MRIKDLQFEAHCLAKEKGWYDMAEFLKLDIEKAIEVKMAYNRTRPHKHGGKAI